VFILMELARNLTTTLKDLLPFELYGERAMLTAASVICVLQQEQFVFATNIGRRPQMVRTIDLPDQNHASVQFNYVLCLANGRDVAPSEAKADGYFKLAADQNDASSQNSHAICLATGRGVVKDEAEAIRYYKLAVDQNDTDAQYDYTVCLDDG
jgi:TPR repeat protein